MEQLAKEQFEKSITYEIALIIAVLKHSAGFDLDLFGGMLSVRSTDQSTFEVDWDQDWEEFDETPGKRYESFSTAEEAARYFVEKRHKYRLGVDFEQEDFKENLNEHLR